MKSFLGRILLSAATVIVLFLLIETGFRFYFHFKDGYGFFKNVGYQAEDPVLGWKISDIPEGDPSSSKFKILFLGDSFTALWGEHQLENMYYSVVKENLNVEIFVAGGPGYSSFQEYLVLDQMLDRIKPDLVLLQVTSNDFINNSWELERQSNRHNGVAIRPYYKNSRIEYRYSRGNYYVRHYLMPYSYFLYFVLTRMDALRSKLASENKLPTIEQRIEAEGLEFDLFRQSVETTSQVIGKIKERCGSIPLIAFPVFDNEPYFGAFRTIFKRHNIEFYDTLPSEVWAFELKEYPHHTLPLQDNDHWSDAGQRQCGLLLSGFLKNRIRKV